MGYLMAKYDYETDLRLQKRESYDNGYNISCRIIAEIMDHPFIANKEIAKKISCGEERVTRCDE